MLFPKLLKVNGKEYKMPAEHETVDIVLQFRDWIAEKIGDPFVEAKKSIELLTDDAEKKLIVKEARVLADQLRCFTLKSPLFEKWIRTPEGQRQFIYLVLQVHQPDVTLNEAAAAAIAWAKAQPTPSKEELEKNGLTPTEELSLIGTAA